VFNRFSSLCKNGKIRLLNLLDRDWSDWMTIDWKKEVELRKEDLLKDLFTLLRIDSVRDDSKATEEAPVGPGPKEALEAFLAIGERDGFTTKQVGNLAGHIEFAPNPDFKETLGVLGRLPSFLSERSLPSAIQIIQS